MTGITYGPTTTHKRFGRDGLPLPSDLTGAEWAILEPPFGPRSQPGHLPVWSYRRIAGTVLYLLRGDLQWRMLPPALFSPSHQSRLNSSGAIDTQATARISFILPV